MFLTWNLGLGTWDLDCKSAYITFYKLSQQFLSKAVTIIGISLAFIFVRSATAYLNSSSELESGGEACIFLMRNARFATGSKI
jgi:hypothetical protein